MDLEDLVQVQGENQVAYNSVISLQSSGWPGIEVFFALLSLLEVAAKLTVKYAYNNLIIQHQKMNTFVFMS